MAEATPRPWMQGEANDIWSADRKYRIGTTIMAMRRASQEDLANAELIVRAVNAHDDLVAACREALEAFEEEIDRETRLKSMRSWHARDLCEAALRKARGENGGA